MPPSSDHRSASTFRSGSYCLYSNGTKLMAHCRKCSSLNLAQRCKSCHLLLISGIPAVRMQTLSSSASPLPLLGLLSLGILCPCETHVPCLKLAATSRWQHADRPLGFIQAVGRYIRAVARRSRSPELQKELPMFCESQLYEKMPCLVLDAE